MRVLWAVMIGAAIGGAARHGVALLIQQRAPAFPFATIVINVTGSFLLGAIMRFALESGSMSLELRALLTTGFCGGYTTYSTFSFETAVMIEDSQYAKAALYVGSTLVVALLAVFLGFAAANHMLALRARA